MNGALILKPEPCCDLWPLCYCDNEEPPDDDDYEDDIEAEFVEDDEEDGDEDADMIRDLYDAERQYMPEPRSVWPW